MPVEEQPVAPDATEGESVKIVRYPNRRLYDRSQGRYVTLQDIATMVREGKTVSVHDSKTNDDLTSAILTQIILEHHPERMELLPVPILHLMLRSNGVVVGMLREYIRQSLGYVEFWHRASAFSPMRASTEWLKSLMPLRATGGDNEPIAAAPSLSPEGGEKREELDASMLVQRIDELERRLAALSSAAAESEGDGKPEPKPNRKGTGRR